MPKKSETPSHPGIFIRKHIIPKGMSVTTAAKSLGVGRPALSNLLNGNSSLSPNMALRLEKSFGADRQKLLGLQSAFDHYNRRDKEKTVTVRAYVPGFLTIKARQIEAWAESNHDARSLLPVLLRKLVYSTGHELRQVDFPGYDNAQRKGWDGLIEADAATPWIPEGKSGWEFSTNRNPGSKAESDYKARVRSVSPTERHECTFVFVTPRNWTSKTKWAEDKRALEHWKAVRAYDASDLEQWLEESIPAQIWLAEELDLEFDGFETLDHFWARWTAASDPSITPIIFEPSITTYRGKFKRWLENQSERPFVVAADSRGEALAFLACLFGDHSIETRPRDLAVVFESTQALRKLAGSQVPFIPIVCTKEAERELATIYRRLHCIVVRPRNAIDSKPDIALDLLNHSAFTKALAEMYIKHDRAERLARESGRSPTILRRRLSKIDAIRKPEWAGDAEIARRLIPIALVGAWHAKSKADCEVVSTLADRSYHEIEENFTQLLPFDDAPVWSVGTYRGVASKMDALFAIHKLVTRRNLTEFFWLAEYVLSESDPALDLPPDRRWAAGLYGKLRNHSTALRDGICETLVILSVHGNNLFQNRLGIDLAARVSLLIRSLLTPLTLEKLLSHGNDLPHYAEAAPDEFLNLLESDLQQDSPITLGLLRPVDSDLFSECPRTGLLWALECLAWKNLGRVNTILAQLSRTIIEDNWANKPIASLQAIYRSWVPQTAALLDERKQALETLAKRFPDVGWRICIEQLDTGHQLGDYSYRPRWRGDASGAGQPVTSRESGEFNRKALDLVLGWPKHDEKTLGDLVERVQEMSEQNQVRVWNLIEEWAVSEAEDRAKAGLRERIRQSEFTRLVQQRGLSNAAQDRAQVAYKNLQPHDPVVRHTWLFAQHWIEVSDAVIEAENFDYDKNYERIYKLRNAGMKEIWAERGFAAVIALLSNSEAPDTVGASLSPCIASKDARADFLRQCLSTTGHLVRKVDGCIQGFLMSLGEEVRSEILSAVAEHAETGSTARLFRGAPFAQATWRLLDRYGEKVRDRYWQEVSPFRGRHSEAELIELIDRLLEARRPRAAFQAVRFEWSRIETSRLKRLLFDVATVHAEPANHYKIERYQISKALSSLDGRSGVSPDEMARLEFLYIKALDRSDHGIPNLARQIAKSPNMFVQALALVFKRRNNGQDPPEWRIEDPEQRDEMAMSAHRLLDQINHIPGTGTDGRIDTQALFAWVIEVRRLCVEHGRAESGDEYIGQLLSRSQSEEDGTWPCLPICEVMERIASRHIGIGFSIGVRNGRFMQLTRNVGRVEREKAAQYRERAKQRAFDYPHVSGILEGIAADYDSTGQWWNTEAEIEKRLRH